MIVQVLGFDYGCKFDVTFMLMANHFSQVPSDNGTWNGERNKND